MSSSISKCSAFAPQPSFSFSKMGCKDCYISPAQAQAWCRNPMLCGCGDWLVLVLSPEVTFHIQQRIDHYCNLNNFVSKELELCRKALVDISIELYSIYIYIVSDYLVGIHIDIFTDIIFKFIILKLLASSESIIFYFSLWAFCSHQVHIWEISVLLLLGFIPVASLGRLLLNHSLIAYKSSYLRCLSPHSLITSIKTVLLTRITIIQQSNETQSQFCALHNHGPTHW